MEREIKRNKVMRAWYRYRKPGGLILGVLLVILLIVFLIFKAAGNGGNSQQGQTEPSTEVVTEPVTTEPVVIETEASTEEETTEPQPVVETPVQEDFTSADFYSDAVVVGDTFVSGIELYSLLNASKLKYDTNWTTGKAESAVSTIAATGAAKVVLEIGINDLNYEGRDAQRVYNDYMSLINAIKGAMPNAQIYVVSVFPVTSGFESKSNILITNSNIKQLNEKLSAIELENVRYIDIYSSLIDANGALSTELSNSGLNIKKAYYPFILNQIAKKAQE